MYVGRRGFESYRVHQISFGSFKIEVMSRTHGVGIESYPNDQFFTGGRVVEGDRLLIY